MKNIYAAERMCSICKTKSEQIISNSRSCRAFWRGILDNTRQLVSVNNSSAAVVKGERSKMRCKPQNAERCFCEQALRCLTHGVIELLLHVHSRKQGVGGTSLFTESFLSYVCMCWLNSSLCICRNGMERTTAWSTILKNAIPNITPPLFVWFFYFILRHGFPFLSFNFFFGSDSQSEDGKPCKMYKNKTTYQKSERSQKHIYWKSEGSYSSRGWWLDIEQLDL